MFLDNSDRPQGKIVSYFVKNSNFRIFVLEFIACVFLIYMTSNIGYLQPFEGHPHDNNIYKILYVALVVYSIICFIGSITGAHINPAVTLSFMLDKKRQKGDLKATFSYMTAQYLGCTLGGLFSYYIQDNIHAIYQKVPETIDILKDSVEEFIATFIFITFIHIVTNQETTFVYQESWIHLNIGICYYFCLTFSKLSILNPAVTLGVQLSAFLIKDDIETGTFGAILCLMIAQFLAGALSQQFFRKVYLDLMREWKKTISD